MEKFEMHVHTAECDKVAQVGGADIVKAYRRSGYTGIVITDHCFSLFHEWYKDELVGLSHRKTVERWLKGYYAAREEGEKTGFTVLLGAEVRFDGTINDYLVYGVEEKFFYEMPLLHQLNGLNELVEILPPQACVVQAHPFRNNMTVQDPTLLFGIEAHNGRTDAFRNQMAKLYAEHYGKRMLSGSDFHRMKDLGKGGIEINERITTEAGLADALRRGAYRLIEN